jgi:superfamily II DNA/RNA helicase
MDLSRFSIDPALLSDSGAQDAYRSVFLEKLLEGLFQNDENLYVKTDIAREKAEIFAFPALYWLTGTTRPADRARALYLSSSPESAEAVYGTVTRMAAAAMDRVKPGLLTADALPAADAQFVIADIDALHAQLGAMPFSPREFGFVIADEAELVAELPGEFVRKVQGSLMPSWERKTLVIAGKNTPKAKNFAWDFADNPRELKLGESMGFAGTTPAQSWRMNDPEKIRFILHLLETAENRHFCVFCNLKSTAAELSARFEMNGIASDYIGGNLNPDRKNKIVDKALSWKGRRSLEALPADDEPAEAGLPAEAWLPSEAGQSEEQEQPAAPAASAAPSRFPQDSYVLVLTDEGAKGLRRPDFETVINYDFPLEPEFYVERLDLLRKDSRSARLVNLVCERYMYGVPAIERLFDTSLSLAALDAALVLPEDLSAGKEIPMPEPRMRGRFGRDRDGRDGRGRGRDGRDRNTRDREGRGRDFRAAERQEAKSPQEARPRLGADGRAGAGVRRDSRPADRQAGSRDGIPGGAASPVPDPYAMSMEERLEFYRRKYGANAHKAEAPSAGNRAAEGRQGEGRQRGPNPRRGQSSRHGQPGTLREQADAASALPRPAPAPASSPPSTPARPAEPAAGTAQPAETSDKTTSDDRPRGLFGKLKDLFSDHQDR